MIVVTILDIMTYYSASSVLCTMKNGCVESDLRNIGKSIHHSKSMIGYVQIPQFSSSHFNLLIILTYPLNIFNIHPAYACFRFAWMVIVL